MKPVRFLAGAREEFLSQMELYLLESPELARRFQDEVEAAAALALAFPLSGSPFSASTRRVVLKNFPFSVIYRDTDDYLLVVAVAHFSRKPGYWVPRDESR